MATVPYNPVPQATQAPQGIPEMHPQAPSETFGLNIANAVKGAGNSLDSTGNELWQRAVAMQTLENQTRGKEMETKYIVRSAPLRAEYHAAEGANAVQGYDGYVKDLDDLRKQIAKESPNPAVNRIFNDASLGMFGREVFAGAGHAATENRKWIDGTSKSKIQALNDEALANPTNGEAFDKSLQSVEDETRQQGAFKGWSQEQTDQEVAKNVSNLGSMRIAGLVKSQPLAAKDMLDDYSKRGVIRGEQMGRVQDLVNKGVREQGSRQLAMIARTGSDGFYGSTILPMPLAKKAIGQIESGNDYQSQGARVITNGVDRGRAQGKYQMMPENIPGWLAQAGFDPNMPLEQFRASPDVQEKVFDVEFSRLMKENGSFNEAASRWLSGKSVAQATALGRRDVHGTDVPEYLRRANAVLAQEAPLHNKVERGKQLAQQAAPDDPFLEDYTTNRIETDSSRDRRIKTDDQWNAKQTIEGGLIGTFGGDKPPTTVEELKATDPSVAMAWDKADPSTQRKYLNVLKQNSKGEVFDSPERFKKFNELKGMAQEDPAGFLDLSVAELDLPRRDKQNLADLQLKLKANAEKDPRVTQAMGVLAPTLNAAGITKAADKEGYYQFVGSLQDALADFTQNNKRPPKAEEIQLIGSRLLQAKAGSGWFGSSVGATPAFNAPVPEKEAERIKTDPKWAELGIVPTDEQIKRIYARKTYQDLYGGKVKDDTKAPTGPQVPVSK